MTSIHEMDEIILGYIPLLLLNRLNKYNYYKCMKDIVDTYNITYANAMTLNNLDMYKLIPNGPDTIKLRINSIIQKRGISLSLRMHALNMYIFKKVSNRTSKMRYLYINAIKNKIHSFEICKWIYTKYPHQMPINIFSIPMVYGTINFRLYNWVVNHLKHHMCITRIYHTEQCKYLTIVNTTNTHILYAINVNIYKMLYIYNIPNHVIRIDSMCSLKLRFEILKFMHANNIPIDNSLKVSSYKTNIHIIKFLLSVDVKLTRWYIRMVLHYDVNGLTILKFLMDKIHLPQRVWKYIAMNPHCGLAMIEYMQSNHRRIHRDVLIMAVKNHNKEMAISILERYIDIGMNDINIFRHAVQNEKIGLDLCQWLYEHNVIIPYTIYKYAYCNNNEKMGLSICKYLHERNVPFVKFLDTTVEYMRYMQVHTSLHTYLIKKEVIVL